MERIGFLPRLGAFLLDFGVFAAIVHLFTAADILLNVYTRLNNFGIVSLCGGAFLLIGYGVLEVLLATTPGKALCGLVIAAEDGRPAPRGALLKRWATKHSPVFLAAPMAALWTLLSPYNYHFPLPDFVAPGVMVLAVLDTLLVVILLGMVVGGCFLALRPGRQTLHDSIGGTAVYRRAEVFAPRSFEALPVRSAEV